MKWFIISLLLLLGTATLQAQHCYTTERSSTTNWEDPNSISQWNWTGGGTNFRYATAPIPPGNWPIIQAPFYPEDFTYDTLANNFIWGSSSWGNNESIHAYLYTTFEGIDMFPEDGWELLYRVIDADELPRPDYPHRFVAFYNRYVGLLRVFFYTARENLPLSQDRIIRLSFSEEGQKTALLAAVNPIQQPLDRFLADNHYLENVGVHDFGRAYGLSYADFPVAYDPCTCGGYSELKIEILPVFGATLSLPNQPPTHLGTQTFLSSFREQAEPIMPDFDGSGRTFTEQATAFSSAFSGGNNSHSNYHNWSHFYAEARDWEKDYIFEGYWKKLVPWNLWKAEYESSTSFPYSWYEEPWLGMRLLDSLAVDNQMLGDFGSRFNAFAGGWARYGDLPMAAPMAAPIFQSASIDGALEPPSAVSTLRLRVPGAELMPQSASEVIQPIYDNTLGVFNILTAPQLEVMTYEQEGGPSILGLEEQLRFYECKLADSLQYLLNPAANLRPQRVLANIQYVVPTEQTYTVGHSYWGSGQNGLYPPRGPVLMGPKKEALENRIRYELFAEHYFEHHSWDSITQAPEEFITQDLVRLYGGGQELSIWPASHAHPHSRMDSLVFRTPLVALPDLHRYSFRVWDHPRAMDMVLKVYAFYVPEDDPGRKPILKIYSFPLNEPTVERQTRGAFALKHNFDGLPMYQIDWASPSPYADAWKPNLLLPPRDELVLEGLNFGAIEWTGDRVYIKESGTIVAGNVYIDTPIELAPGVEVTIYAYRTRLANNFSIPPGLSIRAMPTDPSLGMASVEAVEARCASASYQALIAERRAAPASELAAMLFPNPAQEQTTLRYFLESDAPVRVRLTSVLGQEQVLLDAVQAAGWQDLRIDLAGLAQGIYYCHLEVGGETRVLPLRVQ